ncbi:polysaccharide biosynthesis tyrosine autokinase [Aggregatilinea lenta]|uniref:polysaccharide biosynthesis tyrosine autokinase n=1 Tax=Aggregatilinea lenta TaxID=913108 RepID=UPI000E5B5385|nr:polysaccharide biosynthesis tyrosine autokinase [Aggregatilinea lenta]
MELVTVVQLFRRWIYLILIGGVLAGGAAFAWRSNQSDKYEASVTMAVGTAIEIPNPDDAIVRTGTDLAPTYAILATTHEVLDAAIEASNFPETATELRKHVAASVISDTPLVVVEVTYTDPVLAADIANEIAHQLVIASPSYLTEDQQAQFDLAEAEIVRLSAELQQARDELAALDRAWLSATNPDEIRQLREQRYTLAAIINEKSSTIATFSVTINEFQQRSNSLEVVARALPSTEPVGIGLIPITMAGAVLGIAVAIVLALLLEYFDDTIRSSTAAAQLLTLPVLATISHFGRRRASYAARLITYHDPNAAATEAYRTLRTNLLFLPNKSSKRAAYIITSPDMGEGKTVTSANLAVAMALAGLRVLLIDADLRQPTLHRVFGLKNTMGLSNLATKLSPEIQEDSDLQPSTVPELDGLIQGTRVPGLRVITSGPSCMNPVELLGSDAMRRWIDRFRSMPDIDMVLFDTPPVLSVADGPTLAMNGDLPVLLVIHARRTRSGKAVVAKEQLDVVGARVLGVILNAAKSKDNLYYHRSTT